MITKPLLLTYDTDHSHPGVNRLNRSCSLWGWDLVVLSDAKWTGFGRKFKQIVNKAKDFIGSDYTHIVSIDARDFIVTGPVEEFVAPKVPLLISTECAAWPIAERAVDYPFCPTPWKYCHSPFTVDLTRLDLLPSDIPDYYDDQHHIANIYFSSKREEVALDYRCDIVQSVAFCQPFEERFNIIDGRLYNKLTGSKPLLVHGNGKTDLSFFEPLGR